MGEAILNHTAGSAFHALSGGMAPARAVDPMTLEQLQRAGLPVDHCFTKPMQAFREESHLALDLVISCVDLIEAGYARGWPGNPAILHWRIPDPKDYVGRDSGRRNQFRAAFALLQTRIQLLAALPMDRLVIQANVGDEPWTAQGA